MEEQAQQVSRDDVETFLRNIPYPVLLTVVGEHCPPCQDMEDEIARMTLPEGVALARVSLGNEPADEAIAESLAVDGFPSVIAFCRGEEIGRTSDPEDLDGLLDSLKGCGGEES